jgi:hypothetical protein
MVGVQSWFYDLESGAGGAGARGGRAAAADGQTDAPQTPARNRA